MNEFDEQQSTGRNIPWKPVVIIIAAVLIVVIIIVSAIAFVRNREESQMGQITIDRISDQVDQSLANCEDEEVPENCKKSLIEEEIGVEAYGILKQVKSAMEQKGIQARMPFALDIK